MSAARQPWFTPETRASVAASVGRVESRTAAEIVVTVRAASDLYREADLLAGLLPAFLVLFVYLYFPITFTDDLTGPAIVSAFCLGFLISARCSPVRRIFLSRARMHAAVHVAACEAFVDQGVSATRARVGVLVFVSLLERRVEVLTDIGIPRGEHGLLPAIQALERALQPRPDVACFLRALEGLAGPLALAAARTADDVNELPDEVAP